MTPRCACGCGRPPRIGSRYADYERCRQRAYRGRVRAAAIEAGLPASLSLRAATTAQSRNGDAQTAARTRQKRNRMRKPSLRVSYLKAVAAVTPYVGSTERAEFILAPLLTDRQRNYLEVRS